jgi:hypothetical protein
MFRGLRIRVFALFHVSDFNVFSEQDVADAFQYMTAQHAHRQSSHRFTRNANSYRPLVRNKTRPISMLQLVLPQFGVQKDTCSQHFPT